MNDEAKRSRKRIGATGVAAIVVIATGCARDGSTSSTLPTQPPREPDPVDPGKQPADPREGDVQPGFTAVTEVGTVEKSDDSSIYGGLLGNEDGGEGGSGTIGTIGHGAGNGTGGGSGGGGGLKGRHPVPAPRLTMGEVTVTPTAGDGNLNKVIVRRYHRQDRVSQAEGHGRRDRELLRDG